MSIDPKMFNPRLSDEELLKALDMSTGANLIDDEIDRAIAEAIEVNNPLRQNMPRRKGTGSQYIANRRTVRGVGGFVDDAEEPTAVNSTYAQKGFAYKTPFVRGKVTRKLQAAGKSYGDALQDEIESSLQVIRDIEENAIINGDATARPKEFDGLHKLCSAGVFARTQDIGAPLTKSIMDEAIDQVIGVPNMIITSKRVSREINALVQQFQRFNDKIEVKGGFRVMSYDDVPIFKSLYVPTDEGAGADSRLYILEYGTDVFMSELTPLKLDRLAKKSSQYDEFDVYEDIALGVKNPLKVWEVTGIQPPA